MDRKDLDRQTRIEFNKFQEGCVEENTNTESLVKRLTSDDYNVSHWQNFTYTVEQNEQMIELITKQMEKHQNHKFVEEYMKILKG